MRKAIIVFAALAAVAPQMSHATTTATPPFADQSHDASESSSLLSPTPIETSASSDADLDGTVSAAAAARAGRLQGLVANGYADGYGYVMSDPIEIAPDAGTIVVTAHIHIDEATAARETSFLQGVLGPGQLYVDVRAGLVFDAWYGEDFALGSETVFDGSGGSLGTIQDEDVVVRARFDPSWTEYAAENPTRLAAGVSVYVSSGRGQGSVEASIDAHVTSISIEFI